MSSSPDWSTGDEDVISQPAPAVSVPAADSVMRQRVNECSECLCLLPPDADCCCWHATSEATAHDAQVPPSPSPSACCAHPPSPSPVPSLSLSLSSPRTRVWLFFFRVPTLFSWLPFLTHHHRIPDAASLQLLLLLGGKKNENSSASCIIVIMIPVSFSSLFPLLPASHHTVHPLCATHTKERNT